MTAPEAFFNSIPPGAWAIVLFALFLGLAIGWLIWGKTLARNQQIAFELAQARATADEAAGRRVQLEKELAAARDQIRPLAEEVERLRRDVARTSAAAASAAAPLAAVGDLNDLRLLKGVGDKFIVHLSNFGIRSIVDMAALEPGEAARIDPQLGAFAGRIARDSLIEQARLLADGRVAEFEARFGRLEWV